MTLQMRSFTLKTSVALGQIKIEHKENLVVPFDFRIP